MRRFLEICLALSAERDREALLSMLLDTAMDVARCDAGTLYLLEDDGLHFCRMVTRSQGIRQGGHADPITLPPVPLDPVYVCSWVALNDETINVQDVHTDTHFDFSGSLRYDAMTGYHTQSMLVSPLSNDRGELIGVMQLINALDAQGNTIPFESEIELMVGAIASQAAISITNMQYAQQITQLLDSLVGALSTAIDERTPYNANHTRNMVRYGGNFLDWLAARNDPWAFDENKRRTFLLSVWLHDVGKLVIPLEVMDKDSRLGEKEKDVHQRLGRMALLDRIACLEGKITPDELKERRAELEDTRAFIDRVNRAGFLPDEDLQRVQELSGRRYTEENGEQAPWLTPEETVCLSVRKGTLTAEERKIMESHVVVTGRILGHVLFPKIYSQVPIWAAEHHEFLNGKGYPDHLQGDQIPREVRLLTILDVFDSLTARDRPYKKAIPVDRALGILHSMVEEGSIDEELLGMFEESRAWEQTNGGDTSRQKEG